jgi:hypothetical protein
MSTYNIRENFSYALATSSIEYIRNYNFNTTTVTDIPLAMANTGTEIPITVNISASVPWIQIVSTTGANLKYPNGNIVLGPTSTSVVLVKIDLPPDIENIPDTVIHPNISLDIKSGSFPIIPLSNGATDTRNTIVASQNVYTINIGEQVEVDITVYDADGNPIDSVPDIIWRSNDTSIVQVVEPTNIEIDYNPHTPRIIRAISSGETTVTITAGPERETSIEFYVRSPSSDDTNGNRSPGVVGPNNAPPIGGGSGGDPEDVPNSFT